jgi:hypothetical protein
VIGSAFAALATLSRYEGWILPFFIVGFVIWRAVRGGYSDRRRAGLVAAALVSFIAVVAWVVYNACIYGDPLQFADGQYYSASAQAKTRPFRETLFLQPLSVLGVYGGTAGLFCWPPCAGWSGSFAHAGRTGSIGCCWATSPYRRSSP